MQAGHGVTCAAASGEHCGGEGGGAVAVGGGGGILARIRGATSSPPYPLPPPLFRLGRAWTMRIMLLPMLICIFFGALSHAIGLVPEVASLLPPSDAWSPHAAVEQAREMPFLEDCALIVTMDGNISLVSPYWSSLGGRGRKSAAAGDHDDGDGGGEDGGAGGDEEEEEAHVVWTISSGGGIIASYQNPSQLYRYSIVPTLDGEGLVYVQGASDDTAASIRRLPMSPRQFAEEIGSYSHTPDGVTYWKESSQSFLYVNLYTGEVERLGSGASNGNTAGKSSFAAPDHPVLVLSRVTTTVHAADVMSRQELFNFTYSEVVPGTLFQPSAVVNASAAARSGGADQGTRGGRRRGSASGSLVHAYVDGTLRGRFGKVPLGSVAVSAYSFRRVSSAEDRFNRDQLRTTNTSLLTLRQLPLIQLIGNKESTAVGSSLVLRSKYTHTDVSSESDELEDTWDLQDPILARAVLDADGNDVYNSLNQRHGTTNVADYMTTLLDGGSQFGFFAISYVRPQQLAIDYQRSYLPAPSVDPSKSTAVSPFGTALVLKPRGADEGDDADSAADTWSPDADVCARPFLGYAENDLDMFCIAATRKRAREGSGVAPPPSPPVASAPVVFPLVSSSAQLSAIQIVGIILVAQIVILLIFRSSTWFGIWDGDAVVGVPSKDVELPRIPENSDEVAPLSPPPRVSEEANIPLAAGSHPARVTRVVGNILLTEDLLGVGSNNTLVYSGYTSEFGVLRPAAIKQLVRSNYSSALKEIENLKKLSTHENILNYYLCEQNDHFLFMALQLCRMSLRDFTACLERLPSLRDLSLHATTAPPDCVRVSFRELADAVAHLHSRGVIHRDIKPHNILLDEMKHESTLKVEDLFSLGDLSRFKLKLSDLGLSKGVASDNESFASQSLAQVSIMRGVDEVSHGSPLRDAVGTMGWQAAEVVLRRQGAKERQNSLTEPLSQSGSDEHAVPRNSECGTEFECGNENAEDSSKINNDLRLTNRVDIFSLGCVIHFTLLPGLHPFGEGEERDSRIVAGQHDLRGLSLAPDALNLVEAMVAVQPQLRPFSSQVCAHPFFWPSQRRLEFLELLYSRLRRDGERSRIVRDFDTYSRDVLQPYAQSSDKSSIHWGACLSSDFRHEIENPPHGIIYDIASAYSCLRFIRHKKSHFDEIIGRTRHQLTLPEGYCRYFESRFPRLLLYCVWFAARNLATEPDFEKFKLRLLSESPFFATASPPAAVVGALELPPPLPRRVAKVVPGDDNKDCGIGSTTVALPKSVMHTLNSNDILVSSKSRGYFYVDSASSTFVQQLQTVNANSAVSASALRAFPPSLGFSSDGGAAAGWRRGLPVGGAASPSSKLSAPSPSQTLLTCVDIGTKPTVTLLISNICIPPLRLDTRPHHIAKALEGDRYRTELCRDWEVSATTSNDKAMDPAGNQTTRKKRQFCGFRRGQRLCDYAHGPIELRCKGIQRLSYYVNVSGGGSASASGTTDGTPQRRQVVRYSEGDAVGRWGTSPSSGSDTSGPLLEARRRVHQSGGGRSSGP